MGKTYSSKSNANRRVNGLFGSTPEGLEFTVDVLAQDDKWTIQVTINDLTADGHDDYIGELVREFGPENVIVLPNDGYRAKSDPLAAAAVSPEIKEQPPVEETVAPQAKAKKAKVEKAPLRKADKLPKPEKKVKVVKEVGTYREGSKRQVIYDALTSAEGITAAQAMELFGLGKDVPRQRVINRFFEASRNTGRPLIRSKNEAKELVYKLG